LCDYNVWIDTERSPDAISYLRSMARLELMENEFRARRRAERERDADRLRRREEERRKEEEKRTEERARKLEKGRRAKAAYVKGGQDALNKGKWPRLTQD